MDGSAPDAVGTSASWLRCYRCWSQNLEVQVHYEGVLKVDPDTGEAVEPVEEVQEAVVQCLDCLHDQPHLNLAFYEENGRRRRPHRPKTLTDRSSRSQSICASYRRTNGLSTSGGRRKGPNPPLKCPFLSPSGRTAKTEDAAGATVCSRQRTAATISSDKAGNF